MNYGCRNTRKLGAMISKPAYRFVHGAPAGNFFFPGGVASGKIGIVKNKRAYPVVPINPYSQYIARPYSNISILGGF